MKKYDIFISYRRSAAESAQLVASSLKAAGYRVFIDVESLRSGKFNMQLYSVIDNCKDFVLVLPQGALDRCSAKDDWVRLEVERAMAGGKNIIPIMLSGFSWPDPMPEGLEELSDYQAVTASSSEYFDLSMQRLQSYLKSRSHARPKKIALWTAGILVAVVSFVVIAIGILRACSLPLYTNVADSLTGQTSVISILGDINDDIEEVWQEFMGKYRNPYGMETKAEVFRELEDALDPVFEPMPELLRRLPEISLSPLQKFQLGLRGISAEEVLIAKSFCETYFDDIEFCVRLIRDVTEDGEVTLEEEQTIDDRFEIFRICSNMYYYGYLSLISLFPEKSIGSYRQIVAQWRHFPNGVGLNHTESEYEEFVNHEISLLQDYHYDIQQRNLSVQQKYLEAQEEYRELARSLEETYMKLIEDAKASPSVAPFEDWIGIVEVAYFIPAIIEFDEDPDNIMVSPLKMERVKADLAALLDIFAEAHPEYRQAVGSAKAFYSEMADGKRPYQGLVVASSSGEELKEGDIILEINGIPASSEKYSDLIDILSEKDYRSMSVLSSDGDGTWKMRTVSIDKETARIDFFPLIMAE